MNWSLLGSEDFPRTLGNSSSPAQVDSCFQPQPATSVTSGGPLLALSEPWFCLCVQWHTGIISRALWASWGVSMGLCFSLS